MQPDVALQSYERWGVKVSDFFILVHRKVEKSQLRVRRAIVFRVTLLTSSSRGKFSLKPL